MRLLVVVEGTATGFSAYSPDLDGCVATGATRDEVESAMRSAVAMHVEAMRADGERVPTPHTYVTYLEVAA